MHFTWLLHGIEQMILTGKPAWNVERTLLTSGALDALLISLTENSRRVDTPYLMRSYQPIWRWSEPPPKARRRRPPSGPIADQPRRLLRLLGLPRECTEAEFLSAWRRFLKRNHPDLNPEQTAEERRLFAEAVGLWRR